MNQSQTQAEWVARRLAQPPPQPPNPRHPRRTNKAIQKTPRERENSAASPSPTTATFQSIRLRRTRTQNIRRGAKATAATTQGGGGIQERQERRRAGRNSGASRTRAGRSAGEESVINAAAIVQEARKGVDGSEKDTYRAGRVVPAAAGGVRPLCGAGARRQGRRGGEEKKLVGEVGEGYKEGGSHLPPLFLSLAPLSLLPRCDDEARRLDSYPSLALPPPPLLCSGWGFLSLLLLPLIPWRFPSIHCVSLFVFYFL
jgi:hypothetical protein